MIKLQTESDKVFFHGYIDFYETFFKTRKISQVAEIGIFLGHSTRWLLDRFPDANIWSADILPVQDSWPQDPRVTYVQLDQGNTTQVSEFFNDKKFDLVIEDGSHVPMHQAIGLITALPSVNSGGLYILEDIHTSLHLSDSEPGNALSVLLAIDHYRRIGCDIDEQAAQDIARSSFLEPEHVRYLDNLIDSINIFKRTHLPDACFKCGSTDYDYSKFKCKCGFDIFKWQDSMTCVIVVR